MADNTVINTGTGGDTISSDELTTLNGAASTIVKAQRMKVGFGSENILRDVDAQFPLPVGGGFVSTVNSSIVALAASGVFTGTSEDVSQYACVNVFVFASHASATDGLSMQFSVDGTNWDNVDVYSIPATTGKTFAIQVVARFFRVVYTNGATLQSSFRMQTIYHSVMQPTSSIRPQDARGNDNDMQEALSHTMVYNGTSWDRARGDVTNGLDVDVTRLPALVASSATIGNVRVTDGTNTAAVKPASTAAVAADPSVVVNISPNTPPIPATAYTQVWNGSAFEAVTGAAARGMDVSLKLAIPAGTATMGAVTLESNSMNVAGASVTPLFATIAASTSGVSTLVALVAAKRIRVLAISLVANAAVNAKFQSSVTPTDITGLYYLAANGGFILPFNQAGWFQTVSGEALTINLSAAIAVGGSITYITV